MGIILLFCVFRRFSVHPSVLWLDEKMVELVEYISSVAFRSTSRDAGTNSRLTNATPYTTFVPLQILLNVEPEGWTVLGFMNDYYCKEDDAKEAQNTTSLPFDDPNNDDNRKTPTVVRGKIKPARVAILMTMTATTTILDSRVRLVTVKEIQPRENSKERQ